MRNQVNDELCEEIPRKRGRPSGKNRKPLSLEERRARNALYERERRNETTEAMAQLAEAAGCEINMTNADLLATVISQLQRAAKRKSSESLEDMKRVNENLLQQIAEIEERLGNECPENTNETMNLKQQAPCKIHSEPEAPNPFHNHKERNLRKHNIKKKSKPSERKYRRPTLEEFDSDSNGLTSSSSESRFECQINTHSSESELGTTSNPLQQFQSQLDTRNLKDTAFEAKQSYIQSELGNTAVPLSSEARTCLKPDTHSYLQCESWSGSKSNFEESDKSSIAVEGIKIKTEFFAKSQSFEQQSHQNLKENQYEFQTKPQPMLDLFTDSEKGILMDCNELFAPEEYNDRSHPNNWSLTDFITGYL